MSTPRPTWLPTDGEMMDTLAGPEPTLNQIEKIAYRTGLRAQIEALSEVDDSTDDYWASLKIATLKEELEKAK